MAKVILFVPEQEFVIDGDIDLADALELVESGDIEYEYDHIISDIVTGEIEMEIIIDEEIAV